MSVGQSSSGRIPGRRRLTTGDAMQPLQQLFATVGSFVRDAEGQDLLEYGMLAALIAIFAVVAVTSLGNTISTIFWQPIAQSF
jgi:Flp pilus assembly pilin Flp